MGKFAHVLGKPKKHKKRKKAKKSKPSPLFAEVKRGVNHKLAELAGQLDYDPTELVLTPLQPYLEPSEAGYDWAAGRAFRVKGPEHCPYKGQLVCVDDERTLRRSGYLTVAIITNLKAKSKSKHAALNDNVLRFSIAPVN